MPKRIEYIDVAKFLAMILVVLTHGYREGNFIAFIFSFHLPLFFFLNGMTLKVEGKPFGDFLVKKLTRYIIPMFGLGFLCVLFNMLIKWIFNNPVPGNSLLVGLANVINQLRFTTMWFLPVLFFSDIILFGFYRLAKGRLSIMFLLSLMMLGLGILFIQFYNVTMVWNFDAAFFGTLFTFAGFAFHHQKLAWFYNFVTKSRLIAFICGAVLLTATYFISQYNYGVFHHHLEMFARIYTPFYATIPCAIMGSIGFTLLCRGITNPVFARPVEMNLALLAFHQVLAFPLFRFAVAPKWWNAVALLPAGDFQLMLFSIAMTAFSLAFIAIIHFAIKYSPLAPIVNQPLASFYRKAPVTDRT